MILCNFFRLLKIRFELLHQHSFGHPFYQCELAKVEQESKKVRFVFVSSSSYPYHESLNYIRQYFHVIMLPPLIMRLLIKLGVINQNLRIDPLFDYSQILNSKFRRYLLSSQFSLYPSQPKHILMVSRNRNQMLEAQYNESIRDISLSSDNQIVDNTFNSSELISRSLDVVVFSSYKSKKVRPPSTISQISWADVVVSTNTGPYVAAESLGKPVFLYNVCPIFGTNGYHKSFDYLLPALLTQASSGDPLSLAYILRRGLHLLSEDDVFSLGFKYSPVPESVICTSFIEYLNFLGKNNFQLSEKQITWRTVVTRMTGILNPPIIPEAYFDAFPMLLLS